MMSFRGHAAARIFEGSVSVVVNEHPSNHIAFQSSQAFWRRYFVVLCGSLLFSARCRRRTLSTSMISFLSASNDWAMAADGAAAAPGTTGGKRRSKRPRHRLRRLDRSRKDGGGHRAVNPSCTLCGSGSKEQRRLCLAEAQNRLGLAGGERPELRCGLGKIIESPGHDPAGAPEAQSCVSCCHDPRGGSLP